MQTRLPKLPPRANDSHKGTFGRVYIIGGSRGMAGSIAIAGMAALRSGAGLVTIATPASIVDLVASFHPCYTTFPMPDDAVGQVTETGIEALMQQVTLATSVAVGPGLGQSDGAVQLVDRLVSELRCPLVVDADGLNAMRLAKLAPTAMAGPRILTPHPGEMERLSGVSAKDRPSQTQAAQRIAKERNWIVVLKGHGTVITNGSETVLNQTGNPKMAVGGSGDCLTGIITALLAQGLSPWESSVLGSALHGKAGDLAAERLACPSILATDIIASLPDAFAWASYGNSEI